jgi:hypothetical protein
MAEWRRKVKFLIFYLLIISIFTAVFLPQLFASDVLVPAACDGVDGCSPIRQSSTCGSADGSEPTGVSSGVTSPVPGSVLPEELLPEAEELQAPLSWTDEHGNVYRRAVVSDVSEISGMFDVMSPEDQANLIILPEPHRTESIREAVEKGRFFVATDEDGNIISFCKLFIVDDEAELQDILCNNIRCSPSRPYRRVLENGICKFSFEGSFVCSEFERNAHDFLMIDDAVLLGSEDSIYFYCGSSFTVPKARGNGSSSKLVKFAFDTFKYRIFFAYRDFGIKNFVIMRGQVEVDQISFRVMRSFVDFLKDVLDKHDRIMSLNYLSFETFTPTFVIGNNKELIVSLDEVSSHRAKGSIALLNL